MTSLRPRARLSTAAFEDYGAALRGICFRVTWDIFSALRYGTGDISKLGRFSGGEAQDSKAE